MKKLLFLLLSAAVAISASAGIAKPTIQQKIAKVAENKVEKMTRGCGFMPKPVTVEFNASNVLRGNRAAEVLTWDFEDASQFAQFTIVDNDGDGFNWEYYNNTGLTQNLMTAHDGMGLVASASYDNDTYSVLYPDNWLISPEVTLGGALSFWAVGQSPAYAAEKFGVYVCIGDPSDVSNFVQVAGDFTATGNYVQYEVDLSAYQGQVGYFAIVHHNVSDMFFLNIDDITLDAGAVALPYPVTPVVTVTPAATTADVAWGADEAAEGYDLRYRLAGNGAIFTFPLANIEEELEDWYSFDADGDGNDWEMWYADDARTDLCWGSESWDQNTFASYDPDNWLISAEFELSGELSFDMWGSSNYPDHLMVYVLLGWDPEAGLAPSEDDLIALTEEELLAATETINYSYSLSDFEGQKGRIIFRHLNSYDNMALFIDNIIIGTPPGEWTNVNGITDPNYTIEGLTPETTYEVQVMGYNDAHESDWSEIVEFTTLPEAPAIPDVYILGEVNDQTWGANVGTKMDYNAEDNIYTATVTLDGRNSGYNYFSFTTVLAENNDDGGWNYIKPFRIGALSNGNFLVEDQYLNVPLDLTQGENAFQTPAGQYKLTVDLANMKLIIEKVVPAHNYENGDVNHDHEVNIADVTTLIDYLLGTGTVCEICADVNGDGPINIADVTALIDILLGN